jgi:CMP-N-acetylneuraminic acid synthetase
LRVIAIIPARGGSKRLKNKNIFPFNGKPLISYTIEACKKSSFINQIYVSSDNNEILEVAKKYGAIGLLRDPSISDDYTPKIVAIREVLKQKELVKDGSPDIVIIPQANSPEISSEIIDEGFKLMFKYNLWEVMSADHNGVQNAAFRIIKKEHLYNEFLSAHCGFVKENITDIHTIEDIRKLEENY